MFVVSIPMSRYDFLERQLSHSNNFNRDMWNCTRSRLCSRNELASNLTAISVKPPQNALIKHEIIN